MICVSQQPDMFICGNFMKQVHSYQLLSLKSHISQYFSLHGQVKTLLIQLSSLSYKCPQKQNPSTKDWSPNQNWPPSHKSTRTTPESPCTSLTLSHSPAPPHKQIKTQNPARKIQIHPQQIRFIISSMNILKSSLLLVLVLACRANNCSAGGVLCPSGTCHFPTYIQGCLVYSSSTACNQCEYNYVKSGNLCTYAPPADVSDCCRAFVQGSGDCADCAPGLSLVNGKCVDRKIVGCLVKARNGTCVNCAIEYTLFGGLCFKKIAGCNKYTSSGACEGCEAKFQFVNGFCLPVGVVEQECKFPWVSANTQCFIPGCQIEHDFGCALCQAGFRLLTDGSCRKGVIEGCERYSLDGACVSCKKNLFTLSNGFCLTFGCLRVNPEGRCVQCDRSRGYQLAADGSCRIANCLVSNQKECLVCEKGFVQLFGACHREDPRKICTTCARNFYLSEVGECQPRQPGCVSYLKSRCTACEPGLYLTTDFQCAKAEPGCIYKDGVCASCTSPFQLTRTDRCIIEGCVDYSANGCKQCKAPYIPTTLGSCTYQNCFEVVDGRCVRCFDGFLISKDGFCFKADPFCKDYDFSGRCIQCNLGYYLDQVNGELVCRQEKFGCNYVDRRCVSCRAPFQYNPKDQSCEIDGCETYFLGGCQKCAVLYDLRYNFCKLPNCLISNKGHCVECDPDYILRSDGECVNKDEYCWKYDVSGFCSECAPEYFLSKITNKCKPREPGCLYNEKDRCFACEKPFFFDDVRCEIYGCMKLASKGCESCFYPMQVTNQGLCSVVNCDRMQQDKCRICKPGFFIAQDGSCQVEDKKCLVYGPKSCQKCVKGYRLDNTGICQYADDKCWDFSQQGHCTNCDRLYFLNRFNKCEIRDSNCAVYSGGRCIECKNFFYIHRGLCYPNAKGCISQKNIKTCERCETGFELEFGVCTPQITKLTWDSIDMDFWGGESDQTVKQAKQVFTVGKTNKYNLDGAISKGKSKVIFSSVLSGRKCFQVDDDADVNGWSPAAGQNQNQFIGVLLETIETFYALDIKYVSGNTLSRFAIEQSDNGVTFRRIGEFSVSKPIAGTVQTFYFTPVQSRAIRLVVLQGQANIKIEFYYSNGENKYYQQTTTYIQEQTETTILDQLKGELFETKGGCVDKQLCWSGLQLCDARPIRGFAFTPTSGSQGTIDSVAVRFSLDSVNFQCYNQCKEIVLTKGAVRLSPAVTATKLRVYPQRWTGEPAYSVTFEY